MSQQDTKNAILNRIKAGKPPLQPLPDAPMFPYQGQPLADFKKHLLNFDGKAIEFKTRDEAIAWLASLPELDQKKFAVYSSCPGIEGNVSEATLTDLAKAADIDASITEGIMGVGEMGAIWITDQSLGHAACALLCRQLYILLDCAAIVGGLHEAYSKINLRERQYGAFYSGPSATADIEAVHITGAQGPLGLTAVIYNCKNAPDKPELFVNPNADKSIWQDSGAI